MSLFLRRRRGLVALSCLVLFAALTGGSLAARKRQSDPASLRSQLDEISGRKSRTQQKLQLAKRRQNQVSRRLAEIDQKLNRTEERLHGLKQNVSQARSDLRVAISGLQEATRDVETRQDQAAERLVTLCQEGEIKPLEVALQATSFSDFANRMYLVNQIVSSDADMLESLSEAQARADNRRQDVADEERRYTALQQEEEGVRQVTLGQRAVTQEEKTRAIQERVRLEREYAELEADSRSITAMLQQMQRRNRAGAGIQVTPWRGSFIKPVDGGRITSEFGSRMHPILHVRKMHTGIDIAASSGTPIHCAAGGVVIYASRYGGYGNCVMVDHGGGTVTLYGHCSRIAVSVDQKVQQGQTIAYVGSTGRSTGPHCHFEVRKNGVPTNPQARM